MLSALIVCVAVCVGLVLLWPRLARAPLWRATITPLASIIGSGFLLLGPILEVSFGAYAPAVMAGLCLVAYLFGSAIRYNIAAIDTGPPPSPLVAWLETAGALVLAFAFIVSVAYYLNLFGAFGLSLTSFADPFHANLLTSAVFVLILVTGLTRGFAALERMEQVSVGLKLAIIAGLLFGMAVHFGQAVGAGAWHADPPVVTGWAGLALMAGLIVTVQGFETTRYLGARYDAELRIRAMRLAQRIAALVYCVYILLLTYGFDMDGVSLSETAIIDLMQVVAPVLPLLLVVAALSAQFSAAVADTGGSGGLIAEVSGGRISDRQGYVLLAGVGLALTWSANIFEIISYASRAFAAYYALQALSAALRARQVGQDARAGLFGATALLALAVTVFGMPVE